MIRHICMFKLQEENRESNLKEVLKRTSILKDIPQIRNFEVVVNSKEAPESNYELSLIFDFDSMDDLNEYQKHPNHIEFGDFIKSVRESRACIDYEF